MVTIKESLVKIRISIKGTSMTIEMAGTFLTTKYTFFVYAWYENIPYYKMIVI